MQRVFRLFSTDFLDSNKKKTFQTNRYLKVADVKYLFHLRQLFVNGFEMVFQGVSNRKVHKVNVFLSDAQTATNMLLKHGWRYSIHSYSLSVPLYWFISISLSLSLFDSSFYFYLHCFNLSINIIFLAII